MMTRQTLSLMVMLTWLCTSAALVAAEVPQRFDPQANQKPDALELAVKHTIVKAADRFQRCYLDYLQKGGGVKAGDLTVDWQITPKGKPVKAELVSSSFAAAGTKPTLEPCVVKQVAALEFPPTGKPENHYTFHKFRFKDVQTVATASGQ